MQGQKLQKNNPSVNLTITLEKKENLGMSETEEKRFVIQTLREEGKEGVDGAMMGVRSKVL